MLQGCAVRSARTACAVAVSLALAIGSTSCAKKNEQPKQKAPEQAESASNVTIKNYATVPDVELKALDGSSARLADFQGDIVILTFLATWNKECAAQIVELNKLQAKLQRYRFSIIGVFTDKDGKTAVQNFMAKNPARFSVYYNGDEFVKDFGGVRIPTTYVLLRDGSIYVREVGFRTMRQLEAFTLQINARRL